MIRKESARNVQGFIPSFPTRSSIQMRSKPKYRNASMMIAIDHFKKQLNKLDHSNKLRPLPERNEHLPSKSVRYIDMSNYLSPTNQKSINNLASSPIKPILPPIKIAKRLSYGESDLICISNRAPIALSTKLDSNSLKESKSHKFQKPSPTTEAQIIPTTSRKQIFICNIDNLFDNTNDSSPSPALDALLI